MSDVEMGKSDSEICLRIQGGACQSDIVVYDCDTKEFRSSGVLLCEHYKHNDIKIMSPVQWSDVSSSEQVSDFLFPPPLNALVYPDPVYVIRFETGGNKLSPLSLNTFRTLCETMISVSHNPREKIALYNVPAVPFSVDGNEVSEDEDEEGDETSDEYAEEEEEENAEDDDDEWEPDEDGILNVPD